MAPSVASHVTMGPAFTFDFLASSTANATSECTENFLQWASCHGIREGAHPLKPLMQRIVSFDVLNPAMLANVQDASSFFNPEQGTHPEVLQHPYTRHVFSRLQVLSLIHI